MMCLEGFTNRWNQLGIDQLLKGLQDSLDRSVCQSAYHEHTESKQFIFRIPRLQTLLLNFPKYALAKVKKSTSVPAVWIDCFNCTHCNHFKISTMLQGLCSGL